MTDEDCETVARELARLLLSLFAEAQDADLATALQRSGEPATQYAFKLLSREQAVLFFNAQKNLRIGALMLSSQASQLWKSNGHSAEEAEAYGRSIFNAQFSRTRALVTDELVGVMATQLRSIVATLKQQMVSQTILSSLGIGLSADQLQQLQRLQEMQQLQQQHMQLLAQPGSAHARSPAPKSPDAVAALSEHLQKLQADQNLQEQLRQRQQQLERQQQLLREQEQDFQQRKYRLYLEEQIRQQRAAAQAQQTQAVHVPGQPPRGAAPVALASVKGEQARIAAQLSPCGLGLLFDVGMAGLDPERPEETPDSTSAAPSPVRRVSSILGFRARQVDEALARKEEERKRQASDDSENEGRNDEDDDDDVDDDNGRNRNSDAGSRRKRGRGRGSPAKMSKRSFSEAGPRACDANEEDESDRTAAWTARRLVGKRLCVQWEDQEYPAKCTHYKARLGISVVRYENTGVSEEMKFKEDGMALSPDEEDIFMWRLLDEEEDCVADILCNFIIPEVIAEHRREKARLRARAKRKGRADREAALAAARLERAKEKNDLEDADGEAGETVKAEKTAGTAQEKRLDAEDDEDEDEDPAVNSTDSSKAAPEVGHSGLATVKVARDERDAKDEREVSPTDGTQDSADQGGSAASATTTTATTTAARDRRKSKAKSPVSRRTYSESIDEAPNQDAGPVGAEDGDGGDAAASSAAEGRTAPSSASKKRRKTELEKLMGGESDPFQAHPRIPRKESIDSTSTAAKPASSKVKSEGTKNRKTGPKREILAAKGGAPDTAKGGASDAAAPKRGRRSSAADVTATPPPAEAGLAKDESRRPRSATRSLRRPSSAASNRSVASESRETRTQAKQRSIAMRRSRRSCQEEAEFAEEAQKAAVKQRVPFGKAAIGRRLKVLWPLEKEYFIGTIKEYNGSLNEYRVSYDDGDVEWIAFAKEKIIWVDGKDGGSGADKKTPKKQRKRR